MPRIWLSRSKAPRVLRCSRTAYARMDSTLAVDDPVASRVTGICLRSREQAFVRRESRHESR